MNINVSIGNTAVVTPGDYLIATIYDASAPTVVVQYQVLSQPYGGSYNVSFTDLNPVVYNWILWENSTPAPEGSIQASKYSIQPTQDTIQVRADLFLTADSSTGFASNTNSYTDASLSGWTYRIIASETQILQPDVDYTTTDTSFTLAQTGAVFNAGDVYVLQFQPIVSTTSAAFSTTNLFSANTVLTANTTIDNTYAGKSIMLQGASSAFAITLPALSAVSLYADFSFFSDGGSHQNVSIICQGSDVIQFGGASLAQITLGQGERLILWKSGVLSGSSNVWSVYECSDAVKLVGELLPSYKTTELNCIFPNGQLLSRNTYVRLWNWVQTLPPSQLVSDATWNATSVVDSQTYALNKGLFSQGDGSTTFRVPLLSQNSFLRAVDGSSRVAGSGQVESIRAHDHTTHGSGAIPGSNLFLSRNGLTGNKQRYSGGGGDELGGYTGPDAFMRTGKDNGVFQTSPTETVPTNTGIYYLIRC